MDKAIKELLVKQKQMEERIRQLEARPEVKEPKKAVPGHVSSEKRYYLKKLAQATRRGDKGPLEAHNRFVSEFFAKHGVDKDWPIPNIFH